MNVTKGSLYESIHQGKPLTVGQQIVFVPTHANGDPAHPECRPGFIAHEAHMARTVEVYYWLVIGDTLRTKIPQFTDSNYLVVMDSVEQSVVDAMLVKGGS